MRLPSAGDKRVPGGRNGLAFGDRLHQPVEIHQDAVSCLVEPCSILRGERADALREFLTCSSQDLEGVLALGRICCGEKAWRSGGDFTGSPNNLGSCLLYTSPS